MDIIKAKINGVIFIDPRPFRTPVVKFFFVRAYLIGLNA